MRIEVVEYSLTNRLFGKRPSYHVLSYKGFAVRKKKRMSIFVKY
jgi:hypothetical protein